KAVRTAYVARPNGGGQAGDIPIRPPERILLALEGHDDRHGPEDLLPGDLHVVGGPGHDRRSVEVATPVGVLGPLSADRHGGALAAAAVDVSADSFELLRRDERPHLRPFRQGMAE